MQSENKKLYETSEVVAKYAANTTRVRSLNEAEKRAIDRFDIKDKRVLVIGCGAGRVPANLLLYGNTVTGVDRSKGMLDAAVKAFPKEVFPTLVFIEADATDLSKIPDESFDVVFFAMNTIDYVETYDLRMQALGEAKKKLVDGGLLIFSSHNKNAYLFSPKVRHIDRTFRALIRGYEYRKENVVGGGTIFKGTPDSIMVKTSQVLGIRYEGYVCDTRNKSDRLFAKRLWLAKWWFPYLIYAFRK